MALVAESNNQHERSDDVNKSVTTNTTISTSVTIHDQDKVNINLPESSHPIIPKINNETWDLRYAQIVSEKGYYNGRKLIKALEPKDWAKAGKLSLQNQFKLFIDGWYLYKCVRQNHFLDFAKLKYFPLIKEKICYFSMYSATDLKIHKLYSFLNKEKYHLEIKQYNEHNVESIIPEMCVQMMISAYDEEPQVMNMVVFAHDKFLIPFVQHFRSVGINMTLVISRDVPVSNYYLNQFTYVIDSVAFLNYAECIREKWNTGDEHD